MIWRANLLTISHMILVYILTQRRRPSFSAYDKSYARLACSVYYLYTANSHKLKPGPLGEPQTNASKFTYMHVSGCTSVRRRLLGNHSVKFCSYPLLARITRSYDNDIPVRILLGFQLISVRIREELIRLELKKKKKGEKVVTIMYPGLSIVDTVQEKGSGRSKFKIQYICGQ